jgi:DNA helicase-2/ATP-dependent DNA helicase PcrA
MLSACRDIHGLKIPNKARDSLMRFVKVVEKYRELNKNNKELNTVVDGFLKESGYYDYIVEQSKQDADWQRRIDNVNELLVDIDSYAKDHPKATLGDYLQNMELITSLDEVADDNAVALLTMHSAKGLEFPAVFVIGAERGIIPHFMALAEDKEDEERRLMYVAVTRAKRWLFVTHCQFRKWHNGGLKPTQPSQFLCEMQPEILS